MANISRLLRIGALLAFNPVVIVEDAAAAAKRVAILSVCALVAGLILLPAAGCAAAALWIFAQHRLGPVWAAVITAAALVLLALIILGIGIMQSKAPRARQDKKQMQRAGNAAAAWPAAAASVLASLPPPQEVGAAGKSFFRKHKGTAMLAAVVAGLIFGQDLVRPRRRR
jgi:hypothetical protein